MKCFSIGALLFLFTNVARAQLTVIKTLCENKADPLGVPVKQLRFGWELSSAQNGQYQTAYQLVIARSMADLNKERYNTWNSSVIKGGESVFVPYKGASLQAGTRYFWRVKVWDKNKKASAWSKISSFCTELESTADWKGARWIGYEDLPDSMRVAPGSPWRLANKALQRPVVPLFRKEFSANKKIVSAYAFISGLGQYEISVNGKKAGDGFLTPGWTYYDKTCLYNVLDVTTLLKQGVNAIGVTVGNGFYNINSERYFKLVVAFGMPKLICRIKITYADGTTNDIISNQSWTTALSPITFSSIYGGEDYDARLEQQNWNLAGFNASHWKKAELVKAPSGVLKADMDYPVAVMDTFAVKNVIEPKPSVYLYDFGQNASGILELQVSGRKGQTVKLIPAEILTSGKLANQDATGGPYTYSYTLKGDGVETWRPKFTYYGFRYVQVEGAVPDGKAAELPVLKKLTSLHIRNSSPQNGSFLCSNELFNRIYTLINWAIKSNYQSVITDCPHREKLSWLEQDYLMGNSIHYNLDNYSLYRKLVSDLMDAQTPAGFVPDIAPEFVKFDGGFLDSPEWGSSAVILPWQLYNWYGDKDVLQKAYPMMTKYVAFLESKSDHHILSYGLGDWFDYGPQQPGEAQLTPKALTATAIYYYDVLLLSKMAALLNKTTDAKAYTQQAIAVKQAFNSKFFNTVNNVYSTGSQTAMAMPLSIGLVDSGNRAAVLKNLTDSIKQQKYALTAGDIGFHFLIDALDKGGQSQVIYNMNNRDDVPGYGYQLKKGATALTESWPALENVSNNHLMLGHIMEWFYSGLAGIGQEANSTGFKLLRIRPQPVGDITSASGSFHTPYGWVKTNWKKQGDSFYMELTIPPNAGANVYLPLKNGLKVYTNGKLTRVSQPTGDGLAKFHVQRVNIFLKLNKMIDSNLKIGLFGIGLDVYWEQFDGLKTSLEGYLETLSAKFNTLPVTVVNAGLVDTVDKAFETGKRFRQEDVNIIFLYVGTYALSSTVLPVVQKANVPVVILNLSPSESIDYEQFNNLNDRTLMTGTWLKYCSACPVPEIANVFKRTGIKFHQVTGMLENDPESWSEILEWVEAANVANIMQHNRMGCMGSYYSGMLDIYTDITLQIKYFGGHFEHIEVEELSTIKNEVTADETEKRVADFKQKFDIQDDCLPEELSRAAHTSVAMDKLIARYKLGSFAYYHKGTGNPDNEDTMSSIILGNSLLTANGIPVAGEYEIKNTQAMKIMDSFGAGGSFTEYYAMDYKDDVVLMGHDGPGHIAIAEGKTKVKPLQVYHGKVGSGLSVEMAVRCGEITCLSVVETGNGGLMLLVAEGESVTGPILQIGNTNSRYRFQGGARKFVTDWNSYGPAHHCAVGIGHISSKLKKLSLILGMEMVKVC